jgi:hypothetical protein
MDLVRAHVALRERPLLDVLDLTVRFCTAHAGAYARLSLAVLLPALAVSWAVARVGGWTLGWAAAVVIGAFADAPFVALASRFVFEDTVRARDAFAIAARALPKLLLVRGIQVLAIVCSSVLLGLPWLWAGTITLFVVEVIVLEQAGVRPAIARASRIARARFGSAFPTMVLLLVAPIGAALVADIAGREVLEGILEVKPPPPVFAAGGSVLALIGWWAAVPLLTTARFFVYLDIRTRTEGWDIQTRFAAIAASAATAGGRA